ncbi:hypothetical protein BDP81DRAFT_19661 [Colletotrichum phormii]|uniref:Uncharacterized protein n=1 Tax=Colletotrichum phormii TaxID=359342 RepID=A0AAJ0A5L0_9PEZI|nr:uncharacterized protein BDP81DRAFT_19661 [Colletotrichum phormii]KAK1656318.1 hypothetical protein BDP81DRAFT_19661 [Colletotrichum phormii]
MLRTLRLSCQLVLGLLFCLYRLFIGLQTSGGPVRTTFLSRWQPRLLRHGGMVRKTEHDTTAAACLWPMERRRCTTKEQRGRRPTKYGSVYGKARSCLNPGYCPLRYGLCIGAVGMMNISSLPRKALYLTLAKRAPED